MTKKEMTEIFSVMMLAWPNAEMFKGGTQKLAPTIELWTVCLSDVDFWTAQQAVIKLCRECKFPPSIAEFKEKATSVQYELSGRIDMAWRDVKWELERHETPEAALHELSDTLAEQAIAAMGGPGALIVQSMHIYGDGRTEPCEYYNYDGFKKAATKIIQSKPALGGNRRLALADTEGRKQ